MADLLIDTIKQPVAEPKEERKLDTDKLQRCPYWRNLVQVTPQKRTTVINGFFYLLTMLTIGCFTEK